MDAVPESTAQSLSNAIGYLSLACWVVVMFPQILLNYRRKSGEGVNLLMMVAWVLGDIFNIAGALMQDLVLSTILIGSYYLLVDSTLLSQTIYYRLVYKAHRTKTQGGGGVEEGGEEGQLLGSSSGTQVVSSEQQSNHSVQGEQQQQDEVAPWYHSHQLADFIGVVLSVASVGCLVVMIGALVFGRSTNNDDSGLNPKTTLREPNVQLVAQAMGTISAVVYIMSYVPQALQNHQRKSCDGLSIWLFLLSLMGNTTYALAILVVSLSPEYLAPYVPWLLGALVPCLIHIVILYQFKIYRH
ncbi:hypothetical protein GGI15_004117 [Coemansia interrupta]|uniref:PQ-loop-domain-containing protein n=1 Tax=Coemansia interrupta TaxID=1126814 RepID=A0A9W8HC47_9FUNG|nr:hypothetical protein GGI15_004117 [Coemansia interrupta]